MQCDTEKNPSMKVVNIAMMPLMTIHCNVYRLVRLPFAVIEFENYLNS